MSPALRAGIGGTILVPPFKNEQGESLWARGTYRHLDQATVSGAACCQTQGHLNALPQSEAADCQDANRYHDFLSCAH